MKSEPALPAEIDEVERCRRVRRALEQTHGGLEGLCDWLESLERQRAVKRAPRAGSKSQPARRQQTRQG